MAASRISLNSPDLVDVTSVMEAFQTINKCVITIRGRVESVRGSGCLTFLVEAHQADIEIGEAPALGSVKCHLGSSNHKTMESALLWAMYQLDWQLAKLALEKTGKTA